MTIPRVYKNFLIIPLLLLYTLSYSQKNKKKLEFHHSSGLPTPPNCKYIYKNIFIDETEIANIHYLEYRSYIKRDSTDQFYYNQIQDSTVWESKYLQERYSTLQKYFYYPVVGVTYEQAKNFCYWRSAVLNEKFREQLKRGNIRFSFKCRLPTKDEWEYAASGGLLSKPELLGMQDLGKSVYKSQMLRDSPGYMEILDSLKISYNKKQSKIYSIALNTSDDFVYDNNYFDVASLSEPTKYIFNSPPNLLGIRDMIGNVAEMIDEKGIAKGGSYNDSLNQISISKDYIYSGPTAWLGFRCICEVETRYQH